MDKYEKSHRHSRWLAIRLWLFLQAACLTISPASPYEYRLVHSIACSRQVPPRRLNRSAPEIVSISSKAYLHCHGTPVRVASAVWIDERGAQQARGFNSAPAHSSENAHHQIWFFVHRAPHGAFSSGTTKE